MILNNAPMSAYPEDEFFKNLPNPVLISLPGTSQSDNELAGSSILNILTKLKSQNLRGTFKGAYELVVQIYKRLGWDGLLDCRSKVFVMESEYRAIESEGEIEIENENEKEIEIEREIEGERSLEGTCDNSTENNRENNRENSENGGALIKSPLNEPLSFPILPSPHFLRSTGKKLCEKWLDNLILILFEDLRIYSLYEEELKNQKETSKGIKEWLLLGKLSQRLGHQVKTTDRYF